MSQRKTYYEFLGVPRQATPDEIDERFQALARKYHPENTGNKVEAQNLFRQISQAYKVLNDPIRRAEYDRALAKLAPPPAAPIRPQPASAPPPAPVPRTSLPRSPLESAAMGRLLSQAEGDALAETGQWEEALAAYRSALGRQPNPPLQAKITRLEHQIARRSGPAPESSRAEATPPAPSEKPTFWRRLLGRTSATV